MPPEFAGGRAGRAAAELEEPAGFLCRTVEEGPARGLEPPEPTVVEEAGAGIVEICLVLFQQEKPF